MYETRRRNIEGMYCPFANPCTITSWWWLEFQTWKASFTGVAVPLSITLPLQVPRFSGFFTYDTN